MPSGNHSACLVCGSADLRPLRGYERAHLVRCGRCRFVFALPVPTQEELIRHYSGYGRNDYLSPITIKRYHQILDRLERFRKTNRLMDVGCGIGYFLEVAKQRGWEVHGTEYTDEAIRICTEKGIHMKQGVLSPANYEAGSFDVLTSFEVIEHINNPVPEIKNFNTLLRPGGAVYITTPNFNSLVRTYVGSAWNVITYPEHLSYYTPHTISRLFRDAGFHRRSMATTGISVTRIKTSRKVSDQKFISPQSDDEKMRNRIEGSRSLQLAKQLVNGTLSLLGSGDTIKALFVK